MSRASPGSFAGYFPNSSAARKKKQTASQGYRSASEADDSARATTSPSVDPPADPAAAAAAAQNGGQHLRQTVANASDSPKRDREDRYSRLHEPGDMLNGVGSASSLTSAASSVFTNGGSSSAAMQQISDTAGGMHTLTPLTNHESSPSRRSPTPSQPKPESSSRHVSTLDANTSTASNSHSLSNFTPTPTPPVSRVEARPGPGEAKGRRIILDPELGPGKAQKIKKATYRDFGAQEFRPPPDPRLAIPGYKDGRLEPTLVEPVRMWKQRLRFSPYQLHPYVWDDQISIGTGPATGVVVTGYDRLMPESQLRAFFSSFGDISSLVSRTDPLTGTPLAVCSVQYRDTRPHRGQAVAASDAAKRAEAQGNGQRIGTSIIKVERDRVGRKAERAVQKEAARVRDSTAKEAPKPPTKPAIPTAPARRVEAAPSSAPPKNAPREPKGLAFHAVSRPMDASRTPHVLPPKLAAQSLVEKSVLAGIKRKPYVFIGHVHVPVMGTTIPHLKKRMKMYEWEEIRCDSTGYYIVFANSKRGEDEAVRCFRLSHGQPLFTYTMHMECQQYGNPNYERSPSPERLMEIQKSKEAEERLKREEIEDAQEELRQRALHLDPTKAALEQLRDELLERIVGDVKARIAAPALFDYLDPDKHVEKRRKLNIPDPVEQQQRVGPALLGQLTDEASNRAAGNRAGPGGVFRRNRGPDFLTPRRVPHREPVNAFADERRQRPPKRRVEVKSLHHRLHDFLDGDESDEEQRRQSREDTKENDSQAVSRRSTPAPSDEEGEDEDEQTPGSRRRKRLHSRRANRDVSHEEDDVDNESGEEDWGIARQLLDPHLIKKAPEDMAVRELQLIIGTLPAHSKLHKHAKRELLIRQRSKADDRLFHIKIDGTESSVDRDVADIELPDVDSQAELDGKTKKKVKTKRKTKKQLLQEREAATATSVSAKALVQDVEEVATPDSFAIDQQEQEEEVEEERADVEWGVSTDKPRRTVEDDAALVLDIDGWQHLLKDDEDYNFLRQALFETAAADLGDVNGWALNQKGIKALNRDGELGPTSIPTTVEGYYVANASGSIRSEGISKIFESEKSKYLPHRLRVAAARERREQAAKSSTTVTIAAAAETQRQGKLAANATGRAARASNRTQVKDLNTTKQNLSEGQQGDAIRFNNLKKRKKLVKFDRSAIHGWGLYAEENIAMNDMIIEYVGEKVRQAVANIREIKYDKQGMGSSYLFRIDEDAVVDATKKGGIARFINHSCAPNCTAKIIRVDGTKRIVIYALKEITKDEELTYDYKFDREMNNDDRIPCLCGSDVCKGFLN